MGTPTNAGSPVDWVHPERASSPRGRAGLESTSRKLTQPEHGMNKPLPNTAVPQRVKGSRAVNPATTSESNVRTCDLGDEARTNKWWKPTTSVVGGRHHMLVLW